MKVDQVGSCLKKYWIILCKAKHINFGILYFLPFIFFLTKKNGNKMYLNTINIAT